MDTYERCLKELTYYVFDPSEDDINMIPNKKGVYLTTVKYINALPEDFFGVVFKKINNLEILYVGKAGEKGLRRRLKDHFNRTARNSTLRRSLGVLFKYDKHYYEDGRYRFVQEDEQKLSLWMKNNLLVYYYTEMSNVEFTESKLIEYFNPPLSLDINNNEINKEFREYVSILRNEQNKD